MTTPTERFIKQYNLGPGLLVKFTNDPKEYIVKNISVDRRTIFVTLNHLQTYAKKISNIIAINRKPVNWNLAMELKKNDKVTFIKGKLEGQSGLVMSVNNGTADVYCDGDDSLHKNIKMSELRKKGHLQENYTPEEIKKILWNTFTVYAAAITPITKDGKLAFAVTPENYASVDAASTAVQELYDSGFFDIDFDGYKWIVTYLGPLKTNTSNTISSYRDDEDEIYGLNEAETGFAILNKTYKFTKPLSADLTKKFKAFEEIIIERYDLTQAGNNLWIGEVMGFYSSPTVVYIGYENESIFIDVLSFLQDKSSMKENNSQFDRIVNVLKETQTSVNDEKAFITAMNAAIQQLPKVLPQIPEKELQNEAIYESIVATGAGVALSMPALVKWFGKGTQLLGKKVNANWLQSAGQKVAKFADKWHHKYEEIIEKLILKAYPKLTPEQAKKASKIVLVSLIAVLGAASVMGATHAAATGQATVAAGETGLAGVKTAEVIKLVSQILPKAIASV